MIRVKVWPVNVKHFESLLGRSSHYTEMLIEFPVLFLDCNPVKEH